MRCWVERWSELRKKEMVEYPDGFHIHEEYQEICTEDELRNGFTELFEVMLRIYNDSAANAEELQLPLHDINEYPYLSKEERSSRTASYKYARFLYALGCVGEVNTHGELCMDAGRLKELCKKLQINAVNTCFEVLTDYGFVFDGLIKGKLKEGHEIIVQYPDNRNLIVALHVLAVKTKNTDRLKDFYRLNYRLLGDDWHTANFGGSVDAVADLLPMREQEVAYLIHSELMRRGFFVNFQEWNEGPQIRYFKKEADSKRNTNASFWLASMDGEMWLYFRIKNMKGGLERIGAAPESVIKQFLISDSGCANRFAGKCASGVSYELQGQSIWRCGCCNPNFHVVPCKDDYMFYIDLVEEAGK